MKSSVVLGSPTSLECYLNTISENSIKREIYLLKKYVKMSSKNMLKYTSSLKEMWRQCILLWGYFQKNRQKTLKTPHPTRYV